MPLTQEQQREIDEALEKEVNELDDFGDEPVIDLVDKVEPDDADEEEVEKEVEDNKEGEEVVVKKEDEEDKEDEEHVDDITELRRLINEQNAEIISLKSNYQVQPKTEKAVETEVKSPDKTSTEIPKIEELESVDYIGDLDMDDVTADKNILNQIINNAVNKAVEIAKRSVPDVSSTLSTLPDTIKAQIQQQRFIDETVGNFYKENEDLSFVKDTVANVARNIASEHEDYSLEQLFNEAAKVTRTILRMPAPETVSKKKSESDEFKNPAFAANTSKRQTPQKVSSLQAEIDEL